MDDRPESAADRNPLEELAEQFAARVRAGERPDVESYAEAHPAIADEIRDLFPMLAMLEEAAVDETNPLPEKAPPSLIENGIGRRFGDFHLIRVVGRGGMGVVYEAIQESLGRRVAVKVLPGTDLLDPKYALRFRREARAAARLHHTNIVPVHGFGEEDGVRYYVMQFIDGSGLDEVIGELRQLGCVAEDARSNLEIARGEAAAARRLGESMLSGQFAPEPHAIDEHAIDEHAIEESTADPSPSGPSAPPSPGRQPPDQSLERHPPATPTTAAASDRSGGHDPELSSDSSATLPGQLEGRPASSGGPSFWQSVARVGMQVADALAFAHSHGILHRDIKPANLLLDSTGNVWVTDFGLAKAEDQLDLTRTGDIVGTLRYMPPEGLSGDSDPRSDICSLGLTLYELASLRPAFPQNDRRKLWEAISHSAPRPLSRIRGDIPRDLEVVIHKAIDRDPAHRYQTSEDLADDLRRFLHHEPVRARRISLPQRMARWARRKPVVAALLGVIAVLITSGLVASLAATFQFKQLASELEEEVDRRLASESNALNRLIDALSDNRLVSRLPGQKWETLRTIADAVELSRVVGRTEETRVPLRNLALRAIPLPDVTQSAHLQHALYHPDAPFDFTPDCESYVIGSTGQQGQIMSLLRRTSNPEVARSVASGMPWEIGPHGRYLAVAPAKERPLQVGVVEIATGEVVLEPLPTNSELHAFRFSPDGERFLVVETVTQGDATHYRVNIRSIPAGEVVFESALGELAASPTASPDGKWLAVCRSYKPAVEIYALPSAEIVHEIRPTGECRAVAWRGDSNYLAVTSGSKCLVYRAGDWEQVETIGRESNFGLLVDAEFHHPSGLLAVSGWDGGVMCNPLTGERLLALPGRLRRFARDSHLAAFKTATDLSVWQFDAAEAHRAFRFRSERPNGLGYCSLHVSRRLLALSNAVKLAVWDPATATELGSIDLRIHNVAFSPDGNALFVATLTGLYRLPVRREASQRMEIGPPETFALPGAGRIDSIAFTPDGSRMVVRDYPPSTKSWVFDGRSFELLHTIESASPMAQFADISPNGRYIAFGNYHGTKLQVLEVATGRVAFEMDLPRSLPRFSPDGRHLAVSHDGHVQIHRVGDGWPETARTQHPLRVVDRAQFIDDNVMLMQRYDVSGTILLERDSLQEIATLPPARQTGSGGPLTTTADGRYLFVRETGHQIGVWDLASVRQKLGEYDLDWDTSPISASAPSLDASPLEVHIDWGDWAAPTPPADADAAGP